MSPSSGSLIAVNGEILDIDEIFGDRRVGFFNMIDTTGKYGDSSASFWPSCILFNCLCKTYVLT